MTATSQLPKLPRKRKKAYIKALGKHNYNGMRHFLKKENKTKFAKVMVSYFPGGSFFPVFKPVSYW